MNTSYLALTQRIGYQFRQQSLLIEALTHCSYAHHNNERLEFLGDAILNCVVACHLFGRFPKSSEGQLTRLRSQLVCGKTLADIARDFGLGDFLIMGTGELKSGGFKRESVLADALEALIGAVYLDSSITACETLALRWYASRLDQLDPERDGRDAKTRLQEMLQAIGAPLPVYQIVEVSGQTHDQHFKVSCTTQQPECLGIGLGKSRRQAEQEAASSLLVQLTEQLT